jgi:predicted nucleic acid-binding Zn ribbon protein
VAKMSEPARLGELLESPARRVGIQSGVLVGRVWEFWPDIVGADIAAHAEPTSLRQGVLRVRTDSPTWATELAYLADELRVLVNGSVGSELVTEVRVWSGPGPIAARPGNTRRLTDASDRPEPLEDPQEALRRARRAWFRRREGGS